MKRRILRFAAAAVVTAWSLAPSRASAQSADTFHDRHWSYWVAHSVASAGSLITVAALSDANRGGCWFGPTAIDRCRRGTQSYGAAGASQALFYLEAINPLVAIASMKNATKTAHASFVYGEALSVSWALSSIAGRIWLRPRPSAYDPSNLNEPPNCRLLPKRSCRSFYSARASGAFAAAISSGYLFSELYPNQDDDTYLQATTTGWFVQMALAAASAHLQVKGGDAFYSDALVGSAMGTLVGGALYYSHSHSLHLRWEQGAGAGAGFLLGALIPLVVSSERSELGSYVRLVPLEVPAVGAAIAGEL